jgi:hypothetical protein
VDFIIIVIITVVTPILPPHILVEANLGFVIQCDATPGGAEVSSKVDASHLKSAVLKDPEAVW